MKGKGKSKKVKGKSAGALLSAFCLFTVTFLLAVWLAGCGTIGPPIPPEEVGLAAKIIEQKEKERKAKGKEAKPEEEDEVVLPPVRPIGTSAGSQADESAIEAK